MAGEWRYGDGTRYGQGRAYNTAAFTTGRYVARLDNEPSPFVAFITSLATSLAFITSSTTSLTFIASTGTRKPNKFAVRIRHSGSRFVINSILPILNIAHRRFTGYVATIDRDTPQRVAVRIKHSGSFLRIDEVRLVGNIRKRITP